MATKIKDTETLARTGFKAVTYRILHIITIFFLSLIFTGSVALSSLFAGTVLILGLSIYYIYDRVWLLVPWQRNTGDDSRKRSMVKTIVYRVLTFSLAFLGTRAILNFSNAEALVFFITDQLIVMVIYFIVERIYNSIQKGKIIKEIAA